MDNHTDRIVPLDQLDDFRVAEGDPDIRGWKVCAADGTRIGEVDDLLVDTAAMKVRYLDVDLEDDLLDTDRDRHILIPVGHARLDRDSDQVFVDALQLETLRAIPAYRHEPLTAEYETRIRAHFGTDVDVGSGGFGIERPVGDDLGGGDREATDQRLTRSEEQLAIGRREHVSGEVNLSKSVETEHVQERIPTRHEEVVVERRPLEGGLSASERIGEDEIRIPVTEEELVVEKRVVPKEEIIVRKQERIEDETVEADLRRERVDIHREGDVDQR